VVDKPEGPTSHDVVARIRRVTGERPVGHAGTLDPLATGVLPLVLGRATRLVRYLPADPKVYEVRARLGVETTTGDRHGEPLAAEVPADHIRDDELLAALAALEGDQDQVPPMFSARKVGGKRLYAAARQGLTVERTAARIRVDSFLLRARAGSTIDLTVRCSPGTYVRTLVTDLGRKLGTGATVEALRRVRSGAFTIDDARPLEQLESRGGCAGALLALDRLPLVLTRVTVTSTAAVSFGQGRTVLSEAGPELAPGAEVAVQSPDGNLLGVAEAHFAPGDPWTLHPRLVLGPPVNGAGLVSH
jgi:tRNA pseudouridine55 synthase